jgi:GGDEF domain-containing protein
MEFTPISIEGEPCTQILIRDKVDDFALEEKSNRLQQKDSVTGLYNRHSFLELMEVAVSVARTGGDESSLFYVTTHPQKIIQKTLDRFLGEEILILFYAEKSQRYTLWIKE